MEDLNDFRKQRHAQYVAQQDALRRKEEAERELAKQKQKELEEDAKAEDHATSETESHLTYEEQLVMSDALHDYEDDQIESDKEGQEEEEEEEEEEEQQEQDQFNTAQPLPPMPFPHHFKPPGFEHIFKMSAKPKPWGSAGYRLGGNSDDSNSDQPEGEENENTNQPTYPATSAPQPFDDEHFDEEEEEGDEEPDNFVPPGMMPAPGMMPPLGGMMGMPWNHNQFHVFGGQGHRLTADSDDAAPAAPKAKDEIASLINERFANADQSPPLDSVISPPPRTFHRNIKQLIDICLDKIALDVTPFQSSLKLLPSFIIHRLIEVMISSHRLTRKKLDQMVLGNSKIEDLNLNYQHLVVSNDFLQNCMSRMYHLRKVSLVACFGFTDVGMDNFKRMEHLTSLNLTDCVVTNVSVKSLKTLVKLEELSLRNTKITDNGLILLSSLVELKYLDLSKCNVTDDGVIFSVPGYTKLETLNLSGTSVSVKSIQKLTKLPLVNLHLANCLNVENQSLFFITSFGKTLKQLDITGTKIGGVGFVNLMRLPNLTALNLPGRDSLQDSHVVHLNCLQNVRKLDLSDYIHITSIVTLNQLKYLCELSLSNTKISDDSVDRIVGCMNIEVLNLDRTKVTDIGAAKLASLSLNTLSLMATSIRGDCLASLAQINTLTSLNIASNDIPDAKIMPLLELRSLSYIDLRGTQAQSVLTKFSPNVQVRKPIVVQIESEEEVEEDEEENIW